MLRVHFHSEREMNGKVYGRGAVTLADHHLHSSDFKNLVCAGHVSIVPRSEAEQKAQASQDAHAVRQAALCAAAYSPMQEGAEGEE